MSSHDLARIIEQMHQAVLDHAYVMTPHGELEMRQDHLDVRVGLQVHEPAGRAVVTVVGGDQDVARAVGGVHERGRPNQPGAPPGRPQKERRNTQQSTPDAAVGADVQLLVERHGAPLETGQYAHPRSLFRS